MTARAHVDAIERLRAEAERQEREGAVMPDDRRLSAKGIPPPGIAYSTNFARFHRQGAFAQQSRD